MREPVEREIRRMEQEGVIEKIDASPWISNLVPARKKDGSVRVCVNLSAANKALIVDKYPLPTMEEMTSQLAGNTVFSKIDPAGTVPFGTLFDGVCVSPRGLPVVPPAFRHGVRTLGVPQGHPTNPGRTSRMHEYSGRHLSLRQIHGRARP